MDAATGASTASATNGAKACVGKFAAAAAPFWRPVGEVGREGKKAREPALLPPTRASRCNGEDSEMPAFGVVKLRPLPGPALTTASGGGGRKASALLSGLRVRPSGRSRGIACVRLLLGCWPWCAPVWWSARLAVATVVEAEAEAPPQLGCASETGDPGRLMLIGVDTPDAGSEREAVDAARANV
jgi:hypothetical protein